ncbi:hypothetical protein GOP47_0021436 [Adiantum capillus-veneris]|uniref:Uncharacterized protein n=1 Tax=Adiantum capillus-veneris TaxID=13818 RepID=A0A9D4Z693_ADICA|nr:hypothetical protein GOP47_0021436 [Adiantum capillus-veneris]
MSDFVKAHGDSFVKALVKGVDYAGSFTYNTQTAREKRSLTTQMKEAGMCDSSVWAMNDKKLQEFHKPVKVQVGFHQCLRGMSAAIPIHGPSNMLCFVHDSFPTLTIDIPFILRRELLGYGCNRSRPIHVFKL